MRFQVEAGRYVRVGMSEVRVGMLKAELMLLLLATAAGRAKERDQRGHPMAESILFPPSPHPPPSSSHTRPGLPIAEDQSPIGGPRLPVADKSPFPARPH